MKIEGNVLVQVGKDDIVNGTVIIPDSVTSIGEGVFKGCVSLTSVILPDSITNIDSGAFTGCTGLTSIEIPDSVTNIGSFVFAGCERLTSVRIPDSVPSVRKYTFAGCVSLTDIVIPNNVTRIGSFAFAGCTALTSITIPSSVVRNDKNAFWGCNSLSTINLPDGFTCDANLFKDCPGNPFKDTTPMIGHITVPTGELLSVPARVPVFTDRDECLRVLSTQAEDGIYDLYQCVVICGEVVAPPTFVCKVTSPFGS